MITLVGVTSIICSGTSKNSMTISINGNNGIYFSRSNNRMIFVVVWC